MKIHGVGCTVVMICLSVVGFLLAQTPAENPLALYIPKNTKPYYLDLLSLKGSAASGLPEENKAEWMQKHLAYIRSQVEAGKFVLVGPLMDENRLRGMAIIQASSLEEAQHVANGDPLVQAGRLEAEVHPILLEDLSSVKFDYPSLK